MLVLTFQPDENGPTLSKHAPVLHSPVIYEHHGINKDLNMLMHDSRNRGNASKRERERDA